MYGGAFEESDLATSVQMLGGSNLTTQEIADGADQSGADFFHSFDRTGNFEVLKMAIFSFQLALLLTPRDHPSKPYRLRQLSVVLTTRFERLGDIDDIESAILALQGAIDILPEGHPEMVGCLSSLQRSSRIQFERLGDVASLELSILSAQQVVNLTPDGDAAKAGCLINVGAMLNARFKCLGRLEDLDDSITMFQQAIELMPSDHTDKALCFSNLGSVLSTKFNRTQNREDLELSASAFQRAVDHTPDNDPEKPGFISVLEATRRALSAQLLASGDAHDLSEAIDAAQQTLSVTTDDHPDKPHLLDVVGTLYNARFKLNGEFQDLAQTIASYRQAIQLLPDSNPSLKIHFFVNLKIALLYRFERLDDLDDLNGHVYAAQQALSLTPDGHASKSRRFNDVRAAYDTRYDRLERPEDLNCAVFSAQKAVDLVADDHPDKINYLECLRGVLLTRSKHLQDVEDLHRVIAVAQHIARPPTVHGNPHEPSNSIALSYAFRTRFDHLGDPADLSQAVAAAQRVVDLTADDHVHIAGRLIDLGAAVIKRFGQFHDIEDLQHSISLFQRAIGLISSDDPDKAFLEAICYSNLAIAFVQRYTRLNDAEDLMRSVTAAERGVDLTPEGRSDMPIHLHALGSAYKARYSCTGSITDLDQAILADKRAVQLLSGDRADHAVYHETLGKTFLTRFERFKDVADLSLAVSSLQHAVDLTPDGHIHKATLLSVSWRALLLRYRRIKDLQDLERCIAAAQAAVHLTPGDDKDAKQRDSDRAPRLINLRIALWARFLRTGSLADLDQAIAAAQNAAELMGPDEPDALDNLDSLALALRARFEHQGNFEDIMHAIAAAQKAVETGSKLNYTDTALYLLHLGNIFLSRYVYVRDVEDLRRSISSYRQSIDLVADDHTDMGYIKANCFNNLASTYISLFAVSSDPETLDQGVHAAERCIELAGENDPDKHFRYYSLMLAARAQLQNVHDDKDASIRYGETMITAAQQSLEHALDNDGDKAFFMGQLGFALHTRFQHLGDLEDLERAIVPLRRAISFTLPGHTYKFSHFFTLAQVFEDRFERLGNGEDLDQAIQSLQAVYSDASAQPRYRVRAALQAGRLLRDHRSPRSALPALKNFVTLIPLVATLDRPIARRFFDGGLFGGKEIALAVATALESGEPGLALEWLEAGRAIVWEQLFRLRTPIDDLRGVDNKLAAEFQRVSFALQSSPDALTPHILEAYQRDSVFEVTRTPAEETAHRNVQLARRYESLLDEIRALDGFKTFLLPPTLSELSMAAAHGPVVIINVHISRCDAIILASSSRVRRVGLPNLSVARIKKMYAATCSFVENGARRRDMRNDLAERAMAFATGTRHGTFQKVLGSLWYFVVQPILAAMEDLVSALNNFCEKVANASYSFGKPRMSANRMWCGVQLVSSHSCPYTQPASTDMPLCQRLRTSLFRRILPQCRRSFVPCQLQQGPRRRHECSV
jgi:tetratricopeptide (TPR) repeat protein